MGNTWETQAIISFPNMNFKKVQAVSYIIHT